jgi:cell division septation protein DedD
MYFYGRGLSSPVKARAVMAAKNVKHFEFKLGRLGLILFTFGMALLVFFVFLFGVKVGKNIDTYPEKYSRDIPNMIKDVLPGSKGGETVPPANTVGAAPPAEKEDFNLTFYDSLPNNHAAGGGSPAPLENDARPPAEPPKVLVPLGSTTPGNTTSPVTQSPPVTEGESLTPPAPAPLPSGSSSAGKTPTPMKQPSPVKEAGPAAVASVKQPPVGGAPAHSATPAAKQAQPLAATAHDAALQAPQKIKERYLIQVASCKQKEKAQEVIKKLKALGYTPQVTMVNLPTKGTWYRVMIDGFADHPQAEKAASLISKKTGIADCIIRRTPAS